MRRVTKRQGDVIPAERLTKPKTMEEKHALFRTVLGMLNDEYRKVDERLEKALEHTGIDVQRVSEVLVIELAAIILTDSDEKEFMAQHFEQTLKDYGEFSREKALKQS